ncbi:hypothetical protein LZ318_00445, partial [Saccharopolyspora indica]
KGGAEKGLTEESLQLGLHYREGPLSRDLVDAGAVRAGDRAPDSPCPGRVAGATTLFDSLAVRGQPTLPLIRGDSVLTPRQARSGFPGPCRSDS